MAGRREAKGQTRRRVGWVALLPFLSLRLGLGQLSSYIMEATRRPSLSPRATTSSVPSAAASSNRNPLNLKVTRLLSANLQDAATRAALDTLGQFEDDPATTSSASSNKDGIGRALRRGGLRKEVDKRMAQGSRQFLDAFSDVNDVSHCCPTASLALPCLPRELTRLPTSFLEQKLANLQSHLDAMHVCCNEVQEQLDQANTGTRYLLEHAQGLRSQRFVLSSSLLFSADLHPEPYSASTTTQQTLLHLFLTRFTLSDAELRALTSRDVPVGRELFDAMDKTERIRMDCRALLSGEAGEGTQAGYVLFSPPARAARR